jgi:NADH:ubiquinone oxidoreductase subunit 6 (subunit J)
MLQSKYQRVGVLAGLLMFFGAWLTGYYNHWVWALITVVGVLVAFWLALDGESNEELGTRVARGFSVGIVTGLIARILGMLTMAWTYDSWSSPVTMKYSTLSDVFRVMFNGRFWPSIVAILGVGAVGAFIAYAMPYFSVDREEE